MNKFRKIFCIILCLCLCCPAVNTFAASSTISGLTLKMDKVRELPAGENLIGGKLPYQINYVTPGKSYVETTFLPEGSGINDGDVNTEWNDHTKVFADYNSGNPIVYTDGSRCDLIFYLDKVTDISKICLINHSTAALMAEKYEIYASSDHRDLFYPKNKIAYVHNPDSMDRQILEGSIKGVAFFGLRIIYPTQIGDTSDVLKITEYVNNHYPRICELAIYGNEVADAPSVNATNTCNKTELKETFSIANELEFTNSSSNLFYNLTASVYAKYGDEFAGTIYPSNSTALTDGNISRGSADWLVYDKKFAAKDSSGNVVVIGSDNQYVDVRINARSAKNLGMFYIRHHDNQALRTMHYKVFATNDSSNRTAAENLIAEVYNNNGSQEHFLVVPKGKTINARYYTIRIYDPCYNYSDAILSGIETDGATITNSYVRLIEVAAFTREAVSAKLTLDGLSKVDSNNFGYVKPGTKAETVYTKFTGRGDLRVESSEGKIKVPSDVIECGDKVIADTGFGTAAEAGFKFCGDMDKNDRLTLSDIQMLCNSILDKNYDTTLADVDGSGTVNVTDMICLVGALAGTYAVENANNKIQHGIKYGVDGNGEYKVSVDTDTYLNENFRGFGTNSFTSILTKEGMQRYEGYNKVYHELTAKRLASMKHPLSRIWFQVDWIVTDTLGDKYTNYETNWQNNPDYKNYINGIYDFENETMQAFYEYVEMLNDTGCNIEINFGWKTATRIKDWFNAPCEDYMVGAPKNLPAFGKAAAALIKYLNEVKKYDFVEAITFYNEPNLEGDFEIDTIDDRIYWSQLVREVDNALKANGMRNKVKIWGPELCNMDWDSSKDWFQYQLENTHSYINQWTGHNYYGFTESQKNNYSYAFDTFLYYAEKTGGNMMVTEMYAGISSLNGFRDFRDWNDSFAGYYIAVSNTGLNGLMTWGTIGGYLPDPMNMKLDVNTKAAWAVPVNERAAMDVRHSFYEQSIFTNYIPDGSKVLYTHWLGEDIKAAAYKLPDGNVTVVVENNGSNEGAIFNESVGTKKTVEISFSDGIDRTFKRISYIPETQELNAKAIVNRPDKTIEAESGQFSDTLGTNYGVHIYTTAPIIKQIEMDNVIVHTTPTKPVSVKGTMLDCAATDEIVYTISEFTGAQAGLIGGNGNYIPAASAKKGDMIAVRASLKSDPNVFGVSIIYID